VILVPLAAALADENPRAGIGVVAMTMVVIGNAFSAISSAPELLPRAVGAIGQLLPPGAGGNLVRGTGFFDGAGPASTSSCSPRGQFRPRCAAGRKQEGQEGCRRACLPVP
jgi:hypothetical protein